MLAIKKGMTSVMLSLLGHRIMSLAPDEIESSTKIPELRIKIILICKSNDTIERLLLDSLQKL